MFNGHAKSYIRAVPMGNQMHRRQLELLNKRCEIRDVRGSRVLRPVIRPRRHPEIALGRER